MVVFLPPDPTALAKKQKRESDRSCILSYVLPYYKFNLIVVVIPNVTPPMVTEGAQGAEILRSDIPTAVPNASVPYLTLPMVTEGVQGAEVLCSDISDAPKAQLSLDELPLLEGEQFELGDTFAAPTTPGLLDAYNLEGILWNYIMQSN